MKLKLQHQAPLFKIQDVFGKTIDLENYRGRKVYIGFLRNAGCPVCNLRVHALLAAAGQFTDSNVHVMLVFESTVERMKEYLTENQYPFSFIADPDNRLYHSYGIERSTGKFFRSLANGLIPKAIKGIKLFKNKISQDGHMTTIPSDFLIDKNGNLERVYYGKFIGDHIPITELVKKNKVSLSPPYKIHN
jgi:peroxiredoxin Q/BCP